MAVVSSESARSALRRELLAERYGPVAALVLERVLTAAQQQDLVVRVRRNRDDIPPPAATVGASRGRSTG